MISNIKIHICPVKRLPHEISAPEAAGNIAAVLCTANNIQGLALGNIKCLHESFADVLDERRSDAFNIEQARRIRGFVDNLNGATSDLFFCCDMGESRSAALAACFMSYLEVGDEMSIWEDVRYHPNELVYYLQSVACDREITRDDARELVEYNKELFHRLIARQKNG